VLNHRQPTRRDMPASLEPLLFEAGTSSAIAIARALSMDPLCMLFDGCTSPLDPEMVGG
jgi:glutamate/aspartate transport system ATP-binding protein